MNILISGALGHIGSKIIHNLSKIKKLKKVYLIDNASSNNINVLFNLKNKKIKIIFIRKDLLDKKVLFSIKDKINIVIHLASITNAEESFDIKKKIDSNNYGIFKNILKFCIFKKSKLVHLSSTSVYGVQSLLVDEKCKNLNPQSPYAHIKFLEEKLLRKNSKKLKFITLRLGTITGISTGMRFHTAVNKFCLYTILGESVPVWNNAIDQYRPYLSLGDAIKSIILIINKNIFDQNIYNLLSSNYTVREILDMIRKNKFNPKIKKVKTKILNQNSYKVSRKKFDKLKIQISRSIKKDIKQTLRLLAHLHQAKL